MVNEPLSLSVFFPCYNEQDAIAPLVQKTVEVLDRLTHDYEIIIVDDGSSDGTAAITDELSHKYPPVRVVHHQTNRGYGAALQTGFRSATKEWVFYTDGDGQFDIQELEQILPLRKDADIVSCYRRNRQDNVIRKLNAWGWKQAVRCVLGLKIRDVDCAFKLYRRSIFDQFQMKSQGALIDAEILARAKKLRCRIIQHPVTHLPRKSGQSTGANPKVILRAFKELLKLRRDISG